mgnify:CR=1 FL=1
MDVSRCALVHSFYKKNSYYDRKLEELDLVRKQREKSMAEKYEDYIEQQKNEVDDWEDEEEDNVNSDSNVNEKSEL